MANVKPVKEYSINQGYYKLQAQNSEGKAHSGLGMRTQ